MQISEALKTYASLKDLLKASENADFRSLEDNQYGYYSVVVNLYPFFSDKYREVNA